MKQRGKFTLRHPRATRSKPSHDPAAQTWLQLARVNSRQLPPRFRRDDVRFSDTLVEHFVAKFTRAGQLVFDPFAGYGTTLLVAEKMGRLGYGMEYGREKASFVQGLLRDPGHLIHGDSRRLLEYDVPFFDLCLTSPPYTNKSDRDNPFVDHRQSGFDYQSYLREMGGVFSQLSQRMKPFGHVVIEISNLKKDGEVTTLAWDVAREVSQVFHFEGETVICWDNYGYGYNHSYCLVFAGT